MAPNARRAANLLYINSIHYFAGRKSGSGGGPRLGAQAFYVCVNCAVIRWPSPLFGSARFYMRTLRNAVSAAMRRAQCVGILMRYVPVWRGFEEETCA